MIVDAVLGDERAVARLAYGVLHAPVSIDAEFLHALRRQWVSGRIDDARAHTALRLFSGRRIIRHPISHMVERMWSLRQNVSAYDAGYVALAESLNLTLITRDRRLSRSSGHTARIEYID